MTKRNVAASCLFCASMFALTLVGCSSGQHAIEIQPPRTGANASPGTTNQPGDKNPGDQTGDQAGDQTGDKATVIAQVPEDQVKQYLSAQGTLDYNFKYLDVKESGTVTFQNGQGQLKVEGLPTGRSGDITLGFYKDQKLVLQGTKTAVTLNAGTNSLTFALTPVDGGNNGGGTTGGGDNADLILKLEISDTPAAAGSTPQAGTATTSGVSLHFTDVQPLAKTYCVSCHAGADQETYWKGLGKQILVARLQGSGVEKMPQGVGGTQISDTDRQKLLAYANTL